MNRIKLEDCDAYYHCMSRTVSGQGPDTRVWFSEQDKEVFRRMIRRVADFCGVDVLSYCVMDNHFHVLIRVPFDAREISDVELLRRYKVLYPKPTHYQPMEVHVLESLLAEGGTEAALVRQGLLQRMGDISEYMRSLKHRFSLYFNRKHDRKGTLWAERFKSVLVEGERHALQAVAAYIDLNPVRAALVSDPKDYRFCSYAEAVVGSKMARKGIAHTLAGWDARYRSCYLAQYRMTLFGVGGHKSRETSAYISREDAVRVLEKERGKLPLATLLRCRLRYFTDGLVIGSPEFISKVLGIEWQKPARSLPIQEDGEVRELSVGKGFRGTVVS